MAIKKFKAEAGKKSVKASRSIADAIAEFKRLKQVINDFCEREYGEGDQADFSDMSDVALGYTTYGTNEEWELKLTADLERHELIYTVTYPDGTFAENIERYKSYGDMADALEDVSFDDLMSLEYFPDLEEDLYIDASCGKKKKAVKSSMKMRKSNKTSVKAGRSKIRPRDQWVHDDACRYTLYRDDTGDLENHNNKAELIRKAKKIDVPAWVGDNSNGDIVYNNPAQFDKDNLDNPDFKPTSKWGKSQVKSSTSGADSEASLQTYADTIYTDIQNISNKCGYTAPYKPNVGTTYGDVSAITIEINEQYGKNADVNKLDKALAKFFRNSGYTYTIIDTTKKPLGTKYIQIFEDAKSSKKTTTVKASASAKRRAKKRSAITSASRPAKEEYITKEFINTVNDDYLNKAYDDINVKLLEGKYLIITPTGPNRDFIREKAEAAAKKYYPEYPIIRNYSDLQKYGFSEEPRKPVTSASQPKQYYEIVDKFNDTIATANTEDEARAKAKQLLIDNGDENYDIFYVDLDPYSDSDESYIDTVYAEEKQFLVEGYFDDKFRDLAESDAFYELNEAIEYAHELLGKGPVSITYFPVGSININPDEYWDNFDGDFDCTPEISEWLSKVQEDRFDRKQEPWLDNWQYNTDIGMSTQAGNRRIKSIHCAEDFADADVQYKLYSYTADGEDVELDYLEDYDEATVKEKVEEIFNSNPDIQTIDVEKWTYMYSDNGNYEDYEYIETFERDKVTASTEVNADLQLKKDKPDRKKYNWGKNPITDLDGYVKDIADGVIEKFPNLTYEISDEAITFTDENGEVIYIQDIDEIVPEKEDLDDDIAELGDAIQHEQENTDWYSQAFGSDEDDVEASVDDSIMGETTLITYEFPSASGIPSRHVYEAKTFDEAEEICQKIEQLKDEGYKIIDVTREIFDGYKDFDLDIDASIDDDELEPIMGDDFAEDYGFGFDSNGDPIDESTVEALESIAREILEKSEIMSVDRYADINNFNYYMSSPYVQESFNITLTVEMTGQELLDRGYVKNGTMYWDISADVTIPFNVKVKSGEVVDIDIFDIYAKNGYASNKITAGIDDIAMKNWIGSLCAPVVRDIYYTTANL